MAMLFLAISLALSISCIVLISNALYVRRDLKRRRKNYPPFIVGNELIMEEH